VTMAAAAMVMVAVLAVLAAPVAPVVTHRSSSPGTRRNYQTASSHFAPLQG
jgi:hypothetical protein